MKTKSNPSAQTRSQAITKLKKAFPESFDYMFLVADLMIMGQAQHTWVIATVTQGLSDKERYDNILFKGYDFYKYKNNDQTPFKPTVMMIKSSFRKDIYLEYKDEIDEFVESPKFQLLADASEKQWLALFHFFLSKLDIDQDRSQRAKYEKLGLIFYLREANTVYKFLRIIVDLCFFNKKLNREKFLDDVLFILKIHFAKIFCLAYEAVVGRINNTSFPKDLARIRDGALTHFSYSHLLDQMRAIKESKKVTLNQRQQLSNDVLAKIKKDQGSIQALVGDIDDLDSDYHFEYYLHNTLTAHLDDFVLSLQEYMTWQQILDVHTEEHSTPSEIISFEYNNKDYVWMNMNSQTWHSSFANGTCGRLDSSDLNFDCEATILILFEKLKDDVVGTVYNSLYFFSYSPNKKVVMEARAGGNKLPQNENLIWPLIEMGYVDGFAGDHYQPQNSYGWHTMSSSMLNLIKKERPEMLRVSHFLKMMLNIDLDKINKNPAKEIEEYFSYLLCDKIGIHEDISITFRDETFEVDQYSFIKFIFMSTEKRNKHYLKKDNIYYDRNKNEEEEIMDSFLGVAHPFGETLIENATFRPDRSPEVKINGYYVFYNPFLISDIYYGEEIINRLMRHFLSINVLDSYSDFYESLLSGDENIEVKEEFHNLTANFISEYIRTLLLHLKMNLASQEIADMIGDSMGLKDEVIVNHDGESYDLRIVDFELDAKSLQNRGACVMDIYSFYDLHDAIYQVFLMMFDNEDKNCLPLKLERNPYLLPAFEKLINAMNDLVENYDEEE